jgi:hypothetical protein
MLRFNNNFSIPFTNILMSSFIGWFPLISHLDLNCSFVKFVFGEKAY